jgi:hypothetical protein
MKLRYGSGFALAILITFTAACGDGGDDPARGEDAGETVGSAAPTDESDAITPGTVALFDMESLTAEGLDLGRAIILAQWIDDGETILAFDPGSQAYVALTLDGTLIAEVARLKVASSGGGAPPVLVSVVHDGRTAAVMDYEAATFELFDVTSGSREVLFDDAVVAAWFSPGGSLMAGRRTPLGADGVLDQDSALVGVFAKSGSCADARAFACLEWGWTQEPGAVRYPAGRAPWSPDGRHLLLASQQRCPEDKPGEPPAPCSPDPTYEVYSWPERDLVLSIPPSSGGSVRWAGSSALFVDGSFDETIGASRYLLTLDGEKRALPEVLHTCCVSFSPDGRHAITSVIPGEDCSLIDVESGASLAVVPAGAGDTNDTGICQHVSWTSDGRWAIATGVNTP